MENKKRMVIVSGASRGIGNNFFNEFKKYNTLNLIGISSKDRKGYEKLDLFNEKESNKFVEKLNLTGIENILLLHAVGIDKFEPNGIPHIDKDGDGIDDEVLATNYNAFVNLANPLIKKTKKNGIKLTMANIGSISDSLNVPFWQSFSKSKNLVREYCKLHSHNGIKSLLLNVSSTLDDEKNVFGRKNVDSTYWQTSKELVNKSFDTLNNFENQSCDYAEFNYFKPNPNYASDYFTNHEKLFETWQKDLGYEGKKIPLGIRI